MRPYYLYQCDLVEGSGHFRTPVGKGLEIMEGLRGHTSGYAVPTYVIDAPGGGGKIPVMPNYLISYSDHKVVLRNYEGYITTYEEPPTVRAARQGHLHVLPQPAAGAGPVGMLGLLQGEQMWIEPACFEQVHARGNVEPHRLQRSGEVGALRRRRARGHGAGAAAAARGERERRRAANGGAKTEYGPGEEPRPREGEPTASAHGELL